MKILTIGLDRTILDKNSSVAKRWKQYADMAERLDVVIPGGSKCFIEISEKASVYSVSGGKKITQIIQLVLMASKLIKQNRYDLISTRDTYFIGFVSLCIARMYGMGLEIQVHGFEKLNFLRKMLAKFVLKRAGGIRTVSKRLKQKLVQDFKVTPDKIIVCPIFVDCEGIRDKTQLFSRREVPPTLQFTFITIGRLVPIKNIDIQFRAVATLARKYPYVRLIVVGEGPLRYSLETSAARLGIGSHVEFAGGVDDVFPFLHKADCFVMTSLYEGYGIAPIEAACFGLPVIMTDVGCAGEVIEHRVNGLIVPVGDKGALVQAMEEIIMSSVLREDIQKANKELCKKLLTHSETLELYRRSWEGALAHARKPC